MCSCIERIDEKLKERNTKLCLAISFSGESTKVLIGTEKIDTKKRGKPANLLASYCPFCGKKYDGEGIQNE